MSNNAWIFQARTDRWNLMEKIPELLHKTDSWQASQRRHQMKKNDKVFFWQAGKLSGIYGVGKLDGEPIANKKGEPRVNVKYQKQFFPPILKSSLLKHPVLKKLDIIKRPWAGTNFLMTEEEWLALESINASAEQDGFSIESQFLEGAVKRVLVDVHERNPGAREKCLAHYGHACCVCKFDFGKFYGPFGAGFIHVHHLNQLAKTKRKRKVNPFSDLRPVCPNCHAMLHRSSDMLKIQELKKLIRKHEKK